MWVITKDRLSEIPNASEALKSTNRAGVHSADYDQQKFTDTLQIRLLDDDGEISYEALATRKRILDSPEDSAFDLLYWAENDAGCTELQYFDQGRWITL